MALWARAEWERSISEAQAIANVNHPHICVLHDIGHHEGIDYLVMEYLEGETLASRLDRGPLPLDRSICRLSSVCRRISAAFRHRLCRRLQFLLTVPVSSTRWFRRVSVMAIDVQAGTKFTFGQPRKLPARIRQSRLDSRNYDISPDGKHLVGVTVPAEDNTPLQIHVVLNWFEELKRLVPNR